MMDRSSLEYQQMKKNQLKSKSTRIGVGIMLLCVVGFSIYQCRDSSILLNRDNIRIGGTYWAKISYDEISQINLVQNLPDIVSRTNGFSLLHYDKGHFDLNGVGNAEIWVNLDTPPFIHLKTKDGNTFYLNYSDPQKTQDLFKEIKAKVEGDR